MNLKEARKLRDRIRATNVHCVVPLGFGPDDYWAEITTSDMGNVTFFCEEDWEKYQSFRMTQAAAKYRPRSPLDIMIDQACGYEEPNGNGHKNKVAV